MVLVNVLNPIFVLLPKEEKLKYISLFLIFFLSSQIVCGPNINLWIRRGPFCKKSQEFSKDYVTFQHTVKMSLSPTASLSQQ